MYSHYYDHDNLNEFSIQFWTIPGKIVKDKKYLSNKTIQVDDIDLGEKIAAKLLSTIGKQRGAIGLSANQIGINKSVCVVNVTSPLIFINPEIVETYTTENPMTNNLFIEGCLSFPNKRAHVIRAMGIKVKALNLSEPIIFGAIDDEDYLKKGLGQPNHPRTLECTTIQHEIDHLNGITILDRNIKPKPVVLEIKIGRNELVTIVKDSEYKYLKFKLIDRYLSDGWTLQYDVN